MQRTIQQITQQLIDKLPDNDQYYRLDELRSWGFPSFVVSRIKIELERNLAESMIIPKTDWANTQSDAVQDAWQQFVDAIRADARLPASYAKTVIETAVADVLEMLVQPRKNIPRILFNGDDQLSYEELCSRVNLVVVYQHFGQLLPRYMQKKGIEEFSQERCANVVSNADEKLTERYSPLNWAQMLEPLFKLVDGEIDTNLLRLFFEDKKMPRIARKFDLMNESLTRAEFIEELSSPELLDFEGYEDDQSTLFEDSPEVTDRDESELKISAEPDDLEQDQEDDPDLESNKKSLDIAEPAEEQKSEADEESEITLNSDFTEEDEINQKLDEGKDEDVGSLNDVFTETNEQNEETESLENTESQEPTGNESRLAADEDKEEDSSQLEEVESTGPEDEVKDRVAEQEEQRIPEDVNIKPKDNGQEKDTEGDDSKEQDTPIWMRYMSDEEIEEYEEKQEQEDEDQDEEVEEGFIDDPVIDLTNEDATDEEIKNLRDLLESDRELFVEEIFRGSDRAYDEAVEDIAAYSSWREVSKYIEKDIFKRNLVDMYSEAAVDFTDRLQTYFLEKQNKSK